MDKSTVVLVVGSEALAKEVEAVSAAVKSRTIQVQRSPDLRRAAEAARTRRTDAVPSVIMNGDPLKRATPTPLMSPKTSPTKRPAARPVSTAIHSASGLPA